MDAFLAQLKHRAKAVVGAVLAASFTYAATALTSGDALTAHGLEGAALAALAAGLGVHQTVRGPEPKKREPRKRAKRAT